MEAHACAEARQKLADLPESNFPKDFIGMHLLSEVDRAEVVGLVEHLMDEGDGSDAVLRVLQLEIRRPALGLLLLEREEARDQLHIVLDAMVDFLQKDILLQERGLQALALPAKCTDNQPRLCKLHGVCLIDCILNLPSMSLATLAEGLIVPGRSQWRDEITSDEG